MPKPTLFIILFLIILSLNTQALIKYNVIVTNNSGFSLNFKLNDRNSVSIAPYKKLRITDSLFSESYFLCNFSVNGIKNSYTIGTFFVIEKSEIEIIFQDQLNAGSKIPFLILGSPFDEEQQNVLTVFQKKKEKYSEKRKNLYSLKYNGGYSKSKFDSINKVIETNYLEYLSQVQEFLYSLNDSRLKSYIFEGELLNSRAFLRIGKGKVISLYQQLLSSLDSTDVAKRINTIVESIEANSVGGIIKDFRFKTNDLIEYSFYQIHSKTELSLLVFTAKWCGACIEQLPIIREIAKKYSPNLKIVFISLDRSISDWKESLDMNYPGQVTLNMPPYNYSVDLRNHFLVDFIPQMYLVGKNFEIIYDSMSPYDESVGRLKNLLNNL